MAKRKTPSDNEINKLLLDLEVGSESDDDHISLDSVYDSENNDAPYIPEEISSSSDSDSEKSYESLRKKFCDNVRNKQSFLASTEHDTSRVPSGPLSSPAELPAASTNVLQKDLPFLKLRYLAETSISEVWLLQSVSLVEPKGETWLVVESWTWRRCTKCEDWNSVLLFF